MKRQDSHIVIIGNGVAGNSAASVIRKFDRVANIIMISNEAYPHYSACVLANYISGDLDRERVFLKNLEDYSREGISVIWDESVLGVDIAEKRVLLEGRDISYDELVLATGSKPIVPPIEGVDKEGVFTFKSLADADKIAGSSGETAVVIGAGFIGVEASVALRKRGWEVFNISRRWLLPRVFDEKPSLLIKEVMEEQGIKVLTRERTVRILGNGRVEMVVTDKRQIKCDMVVLATGLTPEVELAEQAGLEIGAVSGIKVDKQMMTTAKDVYACGDCVQARDIITGEDSLSLLWHNAKEQGEVVGYNCSGAYRSYIGSLNITGLDIFGTHAVAIGHTMDRFKDTKLEIIESDDDNRYYHRLLIADGILVGAQFVGKAENVGPLLFAIRRGESLEKIQRIIGNADFLSRNPWCYRMHPYITH